MGEVGTILPPDLPGSLPKDSKWLFGQGAGTWFCIEGLEVKNQYRIRRYTPEGELDCDRIFDLVGNQVDFDILQPYEFAHVSHCSKCRILQNGITYVFNYTNQ